MPTGPLWALSGLENGFYALTLVIYVVFVAKESKPLLAGLAAALVSTTRVEGIIFCVLPICLGLTEIFRRHGFRGLGRDNLWNYFGVEKRSYFLGFYSVVVIYFLGMTCFRLLYFGDYLPATARFKAPTAMLSNIKAGWHYLGAFVKANAAYSILVALAMILIRFWWYNRLALSCFFILLIQVIFSIWVGGDWMSFHRFFGSFLPLSAIIIAIAGIYIFNHGRYARILTIIVAVWMLFAIAKNSVILYKEASNSNGMGKIVRAVNAQVGVFLDKHTPSDGIIAVGDAGAIPYFSKRNIIDLHGLLDKHLLVYSGNFTNSPHSDVDVDYVLKQRPAWFVIIAAGAWGTPDGLRGAYPLYSKILNDSRFKASYEFFSEFPLNSWYVYQLFFDKQHMRKLFYSLEIEAPGVGNDIVEFYFNENVPFVIESYSRGRRQLLEGQTVVFGQPANSQLRMDPATVDHQLINLYGMQIVCGSCVKSSPEVYQNLQMQNMEMVDLTQERFSAQSTSNDPILIFSVCE